jgi:hypothetical protein
MPELNFTIDKADEFYEVENPYTHLERKVPGKGFKRMTWPKVGYIEYPKMLYDAETGVQVIAKDAAEHQDYEAKGYVDHPDKVKAAKAGK